MNLDDPRHPWSRLTAAARQARDPRSASAPYGFATRLAALAGERRAVPLVERFALRAVGLACLLALLSVATNFTSVVPGWWSEEELAEDDPLAMLLSD